MKKEEEDLPHIRELTGHFRWLVATQLVDAAEFRHWKIEPEVEMDHMRYYVTMMLRALVTTFGEAKTHEYYSYPRNWWCHLLLQTGERWPVLKKLFPIPTKWLVEQRHTVHREFAAACPHVGSQVSQGNCMKWVSLEMKKQYEGEG